MTEAPLILSRTAAVLCSLEGSTTSRSSASMAGSSFFRPKQAQLARAVRRRDSGRVSQVHGGDPCLHERDAPSGQATDQALDAPRSGWLNSVNATPAGIAEDQRVVVWVREEEVPAVRSPARHLRQASTSSIWLARSGAAPSHGSSSAAGV